MASPGKTKISRTKQIKTMTKKSRSALSIAMAIFIVELLTMMNMMKRSRRKICIKLRKVMSQTLNLRVKLNHLLIRIEEPRSYMMTMMLMMSMAK